MAREFKLWAVSTKEERRAISELTRRRELMLMNAERNVERRSAQAVPLCPGSS